MATLGIQSALSLRRLAARCCFSTNAATKAPAPPSASFANGIAGIAVLGTGFLGVFQWVNSSYLAEAVPEKVELVTSQEQLDKIRAQQFSQGIREASLAAVQWGCIGGVFIYGMRALEPKLFGSSMLLKAGHPRLWFFISAASTAGFAIRGEKKLFRATRSYHVSGSAN